tara:strand:+ start:2932 stop:3351 length:420 start_codon:yes stop_codon:yes gene_type:complete
VLQILLQRYKSKRVKYHLQYDRFFFEDRLKPLIILQVGVEPSLQVWQRYFTKSLIYCIDTFNNIDPKDISYLDENRIYWSRCDVNNNKQLENVMKNIWNNPRFNIIIDNTNNYESLRKYGIGKYYKEVGNEIFCHSCKR